MEKTNTRDPNKDHKTGKRFSIFSLLVAFLVVATLALSLPVLAIPTIIASPLPDAQVGILYTASLMAVPISGTPVWMLAGGNLPPGLALGALGMISGVPITRGTYTFYVTVTDSTGTSAAQGFVLNVSAEPLEFVYESVSNAVEGTSYSASIRVRGGRTNYNFLIINGSLPSGLYLGSLDGNIIGTPAKGSAGNYNFSVQVTDSSTPPLTATRSFSMVVEKGYFEANISIGSGLENAETSIYADGRLVTKLSLSLRTRR